jgi:hypothetical protein
MLVNIWRLDASSSEDPSVLGEKIRLRDRQCVNRIRTYTALRLGS